MLHIIRGRAGSGKTEYIYDLIEKLDLSGENKPVFIVPEQFSFITERNLLKRLGAQKTQNVLITGFSRLALTELKNNKKINKPLIDDGLRCVFMSKALELLDGRLEMFSKFNKYPDSVKSLVEFNKEIKLCGLNSEDIIKSLENTGEKILEAKLKELLLINETYEALVSCGYFDDGDAVKYFNEYAIENSFFKNRTVFVDSFRSFSKPELDCIKTALSTAENVYISICTDGVDVKDSVFEFTNELEKKLYFAANQLFVPVAKPVYVESENSFSDDISYLEKNIYTEDIIKKEKCDGTVKIFECGDMEDECKTVACEIKKLLRSGEYRCRDIAVIERTNGTYKTELIDTLTRYGIPVFNDSKRALVSESVFICIFAVLDCITSSFSSENVMRYLKSGLSPLTFSESIELEKYALMWDVNGKIWLENFTMNPSGFGETFGEEQIKQLEYINSLRLRAIEPVIKLKKETNEKNGLEICKKVYEFIKEIKVTDKLFDICSNLSKEGFEVEANRQEKAWDSFVEILDKLAIITENENISLKRWYELFTLLATTEEVGEIPQGLDEVTVGCADRIRTSGIKAAFLVGVCRDEFPLVSVGNGLLSDRDRRTLCENGIELRPPFESTVSEERFIVYCALTVPSERLFISYRTVSRDSEPLPSTLVEDVKNILPVETVKVSQLPLSEKIESELSAFSALAEIYSENSTEKSTLLSYFENKSEYKGKLSSMNSLFNGMPLRFENENVSKKLFGENIFVSASKIEEFYNCPFKYFCRYGLKLKPLDAASFDPSKSGSVVHFVFENILKHYGKEEFIGVPDDELKAFISDLLKQYLEEKMGGYSDKSKRFLFLYERLVDICMTVLSRLRNEFSSTEFKPVDFELKIGSDKVPCYELPLDEGVVKVTGSVDRVDVMEKDEIKYLRVIDYKTGVKQFDLSKLLQGLNIQMVLYLMALEKNGESLYGKTVPSGVLYLPSRIGIASYLKERSPDADKSDAQRKSAGKLSGMVLNSPVVLNGMGVDKINGYFPVSYDKDCNIKGSYYSLEHFKNLAGKIDAKICEMGNKLHNGEIDVLPAKTSSGSPCAYCDYRSVCGFEEGDAENSIIHISHEKTLKMLEGDE